MTDAIVCLCTCPSLEGARQLARKIVTAKLAACVNVVPGMTSIYQWQGTVCEDSEVLLVIKSVAAAYDALEADGARGTPV